MLHADLVLSTRLSSTLTVKQVAGKPDLPHQALGAFIQPELAEPQDFRWVILLKHQLEVLETAAQHAQLSGAGGVAIGKGVVLYVLVSTVKAGKGSRRRRP